MLLFSMSLFVIDCYWKSQPTKANQVNNVRTHLKLETLHAQLQVYVTPESKQPEVRFNVTPRPGSPLVPRR